MNNVILAGQIVSDIKEVFVSKKDNKTLYEFTLRYENKGYIKVRVWSTSIPKNVTLRASQFVEVQGKLSGGDKQLSTPNEITTFRLIPISKYTKEFRFVL